MKSLNLAASTGYNIYNQKNAYSSCGTSTISNKVTYMVFLGDYVDRGFYGTEVLYTIMMLKIANPEKVILLRGNHEDHRQYPVWMINLTQISRYGQIGSKVRRFATYIIIEAVKEFHNWTIAPYIFKIK